MLTRRQRIDHRDFICKSPSHHHLRFAVRTALTDTGDLVERESQFLPMRGAAPVSGWQPLPLCNVVDADSSSAVGQQCGAICEESSTYDPRSASVPTADRMQVWLSSDGQRVAVPMRRDAPMPDRYRVAGYRLVEAHSMRDIDRIEAIRAAQVGADSVVSDLNFDPETRDWMDEMPYDESGRT